MIDGESPGRVSEPGQSNPGATRRPASGTHRLVMPAGVDALSSVNPTSTLCDVANSVRAAAAPVPGVVLLPRQGPETSD